MRFTFLYLMTISCIWAACSDSKDPLQSVPCADQQANWEQAIAAWYEVAEPVCAAQEEPPSACPDILDSVVFGPADFGDLNQTPEILHGPADFWESDALEVAKKRVAAACRPLAECHYRDPSQVCRWQSPDE